MNEPRWLTLNPSPYPWESSALEFLRQGLPDAPLHLARALFEFIADDGSVNEIDLLALSPVGLFLVEIKSWPGFVWGDAGAWSWKHDGRTRTCDNPLLAADRKAKKLRSLLQRQKAAQSVKVPFIEPLVFLSAPDVRFEVKGNGRLKVCVRDRKAVGEEPEPPGILAALLQRRCPGLDPRRAPAVDRDLEKAVSRALEQAGIRPSQRSREVNGYRLLRVLQEGPNYQDWEAEREKPHAQRRVRIYLSGRSGATAEERDGIRRAAEREFALLETLHHPNILRVAEWAEHDLGPALLFEHPPEALRLDHFLARKQGQLGAGACLDLLRQAAEAVRYAHSKRVIHRALSPQSILVTQPESDRPQVKVFNWQVGFRSSSTSASTVVATEHVSRFLEDAATAYLAPEAQRPEAGEQLDVFSLGTIAYLLFSGEPPAATGVELQEKLLTGSCLRLSSVANGVGGELERLVEEATAAALSTRTVSAAEFLRGLDKVEDELTAPDIDVVEDPRLAREGDQLPGGLLVRRRLGTGSSSVVLLVERDAQTYVLKVADEPDHNDWLEEEGRVIRKLDHQHVVRCVDTVVLGARVGLLLQPVNEDTLADRLRRGPLNLDLLKQFGEDLLGVLKYLEDQGIAHRDIKPANLGVAPLGQNARRHLIVFDFSLSRAPVENIHAGTRGYLDPFLPARKPRVWDLHAERYAAAVTLHEMATAQMPTWGDGTEPVHLPAGVEVTLQPELFEASIRDGLTEFFRRALRRDPGERFHNADEMLAAWRKAFERAGERAVAGPVDLEAALSEVTLDTLVAELPLDAASRSVLDRHNILTARDLLRTPPWRINRLPGVYDLTRRRILEVQALLLARLGPQDGSDTSDPGNEADDAAPLDQLLSQLSTRRAGESERPILLALLGMDLMPEGSWPSLGDVAARLELGRGRVAEVLERALARWKRNAGLRAVRELVARLLGGEGEQPTASGGILSAEEVAAALLAARGCEATEPLRVARAILRAAVETERSAAEPRFVVSRVGDRPVLAVRQELADYAVRLGEIADELAGQDPLVSPARALERLRAVVPPAGAEPLPEGRLVRLAAAVSQGADVSGRREIYPRGMDALRALRLSRGALVAAELTVEELKRRVASRYPQALPLPDAPEELDTMLREVGLGLAWKPEAGGGAGAFVPPPTDDYPLSSASRSRPPGPIVPALSTVGIDPDTSVRRQFEERLQRALRDKAFLALMVDRKRFGTALGRLQEAHPILRLIDLEALVLGHLKNQAAKAGVRWEKVLAADAAAPDSRDWKNLLRLIGRAMPAVEEEVLASPQPLLLYHPGLLARYDQNETVVRLREACGRAGQPPGIWLLVVSDGAALPMIDRQPVPILSPGQRAAIPPQWLDFVPLTARRRSP